MINVEEALSIIENNGIMMGVEIRHITNANGYVLAKDILSPMDMPPCNQSAMDGYAFNFEEATNTYNVIDEVAAGSPKNPPLKVGEGVRIFTGAMVPTDANIVVQQELIERIDSSATITEKVAIGKNIRLQGEQIKTGSIALQKGVVITPAAIGFLTGIGIIEVAVYKKPKITLIVTGDELVKPGIKLEPGQIYESNSYMIHSAIETYGFDDCNVLSVSDNYNETLKQIKLATETSDLVVLTGGISVGDYDFVGKALKEIGTEELFYKVNQKPGKPIYVGKIKQTLIAALPGNPAAALSCFYIYVLPALNQMIGKSFIGLRKSTYPIMDEYIKKGTRSIFLKAALIKGKVQVLDRQSSAMLRSFSEANGLIYLSADTAKVNAGESVVFYAF